MTLLERIRSAQAQHDLDLLAMEVILSPNMRDNLDAFKIRAKELEHEASKNPFR